jgi:hypothetical protein
LIEDTGSDSFFILQDGFSANKNQEQEQWQSIVMKMAKTAKRIEEADMVILVAEFRSSKYAMYQAFC